MAIGISKKFVIYELNKMLNSNKHLTLEKVSFPGWTTNNFDTEDEAIQALIDNDKMYQDFVILKEIYIRQE